MLLSALALAAVLQDAKPDRSGEPALRECLRAVAALKDARVTITMASRSRSEEAYQPDQTLQLDLGAKGEVRAIGTAIWGDAVYAVRTSDAVLLDPLDDDAAVVLKDSAELRDAVPAMGIRGNFGTPFLLMRQGEAAFDKLVKADSPITAAGGTVRFKSKDYSSMQVTMDPRTKLPVVIEFDNLDYVKSLGGGFRPAPQQPSDLHQVYYGALPKEDRKFSAEPAKGRRVDDQRKKKAAG